MKSFALLCIISVVDALKTELCCSSTDNSCCPSHTEAPIIEKDVIEEVEEDLIDIFDEVTPNLEDGEEIDQEALEMTRQMFQWMDLDANTVIDIMNEVE